MLARDDDRGSTQAILREHTRDARTRIDAHDQQIGAIRFADFSLGDTQCHAGHREQPRRERGAEIDWHMRIDGVGAGVRSSQTTMAVFELLA